ncbi:MAG: HDIG domain-containing protein [Bacteroidales bacterium]|nr:HDIG domain-containing protein [Bacteroidales bacterium]
MKHLVYWLQQHLSNMSKTILILISIVLLVQLFPRQPGFDYEYQQARPWLYDDLIAPFSFAILKSNEHLEAERQAVTEAFLPFFSRRPNVADSVIEVFEETFAAAWHQKHQDQKQAMKQESLETGVSLLRHLYERGIIFLEEDFRDKSGDFNIRLVERNVASVKRLNDFYAVQDAFLYILDVLENKEDAVDVPLLQSLLQASLQHNVFYNEELTQRTLDAELAAIPASRGMVQEGEKIISKGELISPATYQILESFKAEYQRQVGDSAMQTLLYFGQFLLVSISMVVLMLFLYVFRKDVFIDNRRILLILMSVLLMVFTTSIIIRNNVEYLYLVPVCIVPIIIRAFFDNRLALYIHIITIILIGFLIPRSFEFVFLQFLAGIIAILSMADLRRRSQLFYTVTLILLTYCAVYFGLSLAHTGSFDNLYWRDFAYFAGGAFLTLFAYPLIFLFERMFGLPTDFSLLELADTNNTLLRKLGMQAPGTFQHSLQVANLAEEAVIAIGGNSLLTRTGALYHDIGKMKNPLYFIENQSSAYNPHDEISFRESARVIIDHVIDGIEMARKHKLPEYITDFIRTHHGTTTARYFYTMQVKDNPNEEVEKSDFVYPGPRPFSKETAVVMMADSVEAASRSLGKPNEESISRLVDSIIDTQVMEKQFDNADITFKDITTVKSILKRMLLNIYHVRVAYPSQAN